jgi:hypothetical protein
MEHYVQASFTTTAYQMPRRFVFHQNVFFRFDLVTSAWLLMDKPLFHFFLPQSAATPTTASEVLASQEVPRSITVGWGRSTSSHGMTYVEKCTNGTSDPLGPMEILVRITSRSLPTPPTDTVSIVAPIISTASVSSSRSGAGNQTSPLSPPSLPIFASDVWGSSQPTLTRFSWPAFLQNDGVLAHHPLPLSLYGVIATYLSEPPANTVKLIVDPMLCTKLPVVVV